MSWNCRIVNLVHDSIIIEVPDDDWLIARVCEYVSAEMENTPIEWGITTVPFVADAEVGLRWGMLLDESLAEAA